MKKAKSLYIVLLLALLVAASSVAAQAQSAPQTADPAKPDSKAANQTVKKSVDSVATPKKDSSQTSAAATSAPNSAATMDAAATAATGSSAAARKPTAAQETAPAKNTGMVWVNTESRVYHKPGSRWYGKTKQGKYMTEADAMEVGYHSAK